MEKSFCSLFSLANCFERIISAPFSLQGMIGLLVKLSSGSYTAFKILHELNICSILKDIITSHDLSHNMSSSHLADGHCVQVFYITSFVPITSLKINFCSEENSAQMVYLILILNVFF